MTHTTFLGYRLAGRALAVGAALLPALGAAADNLRAKAGLPVDGQASLLWKCADVEIEWGFTEGTDGHAFDGTVACTQTGQVGAARPLAGDKTTTMTGEAAWKSPAARGARRGIVLPVLYTPAVRGPGRTIVTVRTGAGSFSFMPVNLEAGPILAPEYGFFVRAVSPPAPKAAAPQPAPPAKLAQVPPPKDLLTARLESREGTSAVRGWGSTGTPCIYANADLEAASLMRGAVTVPPRTVAVHPGPANDIAVGWRSPVAGKVSVKAKVADGHPSGGNGVEWSIVRDAKSGRTVLARGVIGRGGSQAVPADANAARLGAVAVEPGDLLSLVVGSNGDHQCDTTCIELSVAETGGKGRTWDLARDVVGDMQAGNPHADSLGNAGVWYFYTHRRPEAKLPYWRPPVVAFESKATTAREYLAELAARHLETIRQRVGELPEQTWQGAMEAIHGKRSWPPFPQVPFEAEMKVQVPCPYLTGLWRIGAWQIIKRCPRIHRDDLAKVIAAGDVRGDCRRVAADDPNGMYIVRDNPFPPLGCETDRILLALDHLGAHQVARDGLSLWLEGQNTDGSLLLANSGIERAHAVGALLLPYVYAEHYRLTGDSQWLRKTAPRLKAAADWIVNRRRTTMKEKYTAEDIASIKAGKLMQYGLQPPIPCGDGGGRPFCFKDFAAYRSVRMLADVLAEVDQKMGADLAREASLYRKDLLRAIDEAITLAPVMQTLDGRYHSFHPQGFHDRGPLACVLPETANIYSHCGPYHCDYLVSAAAMEVWLPLGLMSPADPRVQGSFDVLEDVFLRDHPWLHKRKPTYDPNRDWFAAGWGYQSGWERMPDCYLIMDDIPNFLRSWLNHCAVDINLGNWTFNEHTTFAANDKSHGNSVFLSNFRKMLVMEMGEALWLARATPRVWLEQAKKISVKNAPTYFGTVAYEIVSDADHGRISATVEMPSRRRPKEVVLRFRHPKSAPIKSVTVNGKPWTEFNKDKETITLKGLTGNVAVTAQY